MTVRDVAHSRFAYDLNSFPAALAQQWRTCRLEMTGKRPTNSGISPYWMRSVCSTWRSTFEETFAWLLPSTLALQHEVQLSSYGTSFHPPEEAAL